MGSSSKRWGIEGSQAAGTSRAGGENHRESSLFASRRKNTRKEGSFARPESEESPRVALWKKEVYEGAEEWLGRGS
jgi:hypothetical protein